MPSNSSRNPRDSSMNIRVDRRARDLIDRAASCLGKNRSDFVLEIACREAENILLDRAYVLVGEETFANLYSMLDNPPAPSQKLIELMKKKVPWDDAATSSTL
jgi:uncharacterized protein (DUF1778 family)